MSKHSPISAIFDNAFQSRATEYYTEGSLDQKSVTRIGSCQGGEASMHLLRILSQQEHRGIHPLTTSKWL